LADAIGSTGWATIGWLGLHAGHSKIPMSKPDESAVIRACIIVVSHSGQSGRERGIMVLRLVGGSVTELSVTGGAYSDAMMVHFGTSDSRHTGQYCSHREIVNKAN